MPDTHPLVCRFGAFGDMVLITPLLRQLYLRSGLPCDVVGIGGWNHQLFEQMPWVRNVYTIDSRSAPYWFNRSQRDLVARLKREHPRFIWVCETSKKSYRLLARAGIERETCVNERNLAPLSGEHYVDKWLRLGCESPPGFDYPQVQISADTELFVSDEERAQCRDWLLSRKLDSTAPLICIQAGSKRTSRRGKADRGSNTKYWNESNWAAVIDGIVAQQPAAQLLLCGVPAELDMCRAIESQCRNHANVQTVADDLPLRRLLALLSLAHSCVSVDTGPAHAAAAMNCPLVVLFGKANPARFRPLSANSQVEVIVGHNSDDDAIAADIGNISAAQVLSAWQRL